jgi:hypothetical protein
MHAEQDTKEDGRMTWSRGSRISIQAIHPMLQLPIGKVLPEDLLLFHSCHFEMGTVQKSTALYY